MGSHINSDGEFQSDKYPTCPPGLVPLKLTDITAQDLIWEYAQRRRPVDAEFSADLETALQAKGFAMLAGTSETAALRGQLVSALTRVGELGDALDAANKLIGEGADEAKKLQERIEELEIDLDIVGRP